MCLTFPHSRLVNNDVIAYAIAPNETPSPLLPPNHADSEIAGCWFSFLQVLKAKVSAVRTLIGA